MKILYLTSVLGPKGGSEIYTRDLINELLERGHEVMVCTTTKYDFDNAKTIHLPVFGHHALHKFEAPLFFRRVLKAAEEFKPGLVQSHSNSLMGLLGHVVKRKLDVPHVLLIELISSQNQTLHTKTIFQAEKFLLPKLNYDKLIIWTERMKQKFLLPWGIPEEKIEVINAALNVQNYDTKLSGEWVRKKYGKNLIVSLKTLWGTNAKGIEYIIKAMEHVSRKHPEWKYVVFGGGIERERLIRITNNLGLQEYVKFHGAVPSSQARDVLAATDIAPHSFVYEFSTSVSLLEYMAMGKPCVVTDVGAVKEFVKDTALVVEPENPKAIADGVIKLIENPKLRKELGRKARKLVEENYSIKTTVDRLEKIYAETMKK